MTSLKYRSDIDGLRAVAVLGVVIYHAFPWLIPGGFIGVDIFFVISGYLISGILYRGLKADRGDGNFSPFSFRAFYARRIRRLFPALITMLVITLAYGWLILLPDEFEQLGKHVAAGTLFIQNIVFWQESGYFDTAANLKPLLHLWSLAVEEQFYIFFPLLLILLWKKPKIMAPVMVVLLIGTFILNVVMSVQNGVSDFFLTPYRAWEFLGGSLLAWWHYDKGHQQSEEEEAPMYREAFSWIGAFLLILGMAFIHTGDPYPGWRALLPVAGTLLLMEGGRSAWINKKILSNPGVVWIGLISYPLYLFHWPALSFVHIVKGESPKPGYILMALLVSLVLTVLTYYFIEKKIRHNKSRWIIPMLVGLFMLSGFFGVLSWRKVWTANPSIGGHGISIAVNDQNMLSGWPQIVFKNNFIVNQIGGDGKQTLFFGDSFMQHYAPRIKKQLELDPIQKRGAIMVATGGVLPIPHVKIEGTDKNTSDRLFSVVDQLLEQEKRIDRVVIASKWGIYFTRQNYDWRYLGHSLSTSEGRDQALQEFDLMLKYVKSYVSNVTVVMESPYDERLSPRHTIIRSFTGIKQGKLDFSEKDFLVKCGTISSEIRTIAWNNRVKIVEPREELCHEGKCLVVDSQGIPIRYDGAHLRPGYVREHVKYLDFTVEP